MTLLEVMVSSTISLSVLAMMVSMVMSNRQAYSSDIARTRLHQNIRSAFDVLSSELRQAGERLPFSFPAVLVVDGASGASDELVLRRNQLDQTLILCAAITTAQTTGRFITASATAGLPPACSFGTQTTAYNSWRTFRLAQSGQKMRAYIYDMGTHLGEFFVYDAETSTAPSTQYIHNEAGSWANNYTLGTTSVYAVSEWRFKRSDVPGQTDLLQIIENGDTANPKSLVFGVQNIQFTVKMADGTTLNSFTPSDNWGLVQALTVTITGSDTYENGRRTVTSTLRTELFPRNILSN